MAQNELNDRLEQSKGAVDAARAAYDLAICEHDELLRKHHNAKVHLRNAHHGLIGAIAAHRKIIGTVEPGSTYYDSDGLGGGDSNSYSNGKRSVA